MMNRIIVVLSMGLVCLLGILHAAQDETPVLRGPYLGQAPPGMTPKIFAPGIVSTGFNEHIASFTPDGRELFFRMLGAPHGVTLHMKEEQGVWTKLQTAPFSGRYDAPGALSPDGKYLFFSSLRRIYKKRHSDTPLTYEEKIKMLSSPGYASEDIYWVDAKVIEKLRREQNSPKHRDDGPPGQVATSF